MDIIDFRFRPNTPEVINGIANSAMFKDLCEAIEFHNKSLNLSKTLLKVLKKTTLSKLLLQGETVKPLTLLWLTATVQFSISV